MAGVTVRVNKTTIKDFVRGEEDRVSDQKYGLFRYLKKKGRITFNNSGTDREWVVRYKRNTPVQMSDGEVMSFDRVNRHERATIAWRSQSMNEAITKMEKLQNKGAAALVKLWEKQTSKMTDDFICDLDKQLYLDGSESGREQFLEGLKTVVGKATDTAAQYPVPNQTTHTYAGLQTGPGYYGGTVTGGTYPDGVYDPEYYFWTPFQTQYDHASFGGTSWEDNCVEAMRYTLTYVENRGSDRPEIFWMSPILFAQFKNRQETKERIVVEKGQDSDVTKLGFRSLNFEGVDLVSDAHVPANGVFGFPAEAIEIASLQDQLLTPGQEMQLEDRTERVALDFFGNTKLSPRALTYLSSTFA